MPQYGMTGCGIMGRFWLRLLNGLAGDAASVFRLIVLQAPLWALAAGCADGREICLTQDLPLVAGHQDACYKAKKVKELFDLPLVREDGTPVAVRLAHPTDFTLSEEVRTCRRYRELTAQDWFAETSLDMAQEAFFVRACGIFDALARAKEAKVSYFHARTAERDLMSMRAGALPGFGEAPSDGASGGEAADAQAASPSDTATIGELEAQGLAAAKTAPNGEWIVERNGSLIVIQPVARADFDGDGAEDALVFIRVRAIGGTASTALLAILSKPAVDAPVEMTMM